MEQGYLIDTNCIIDFAKGNLPVDVTRNLQFDVIASASDGNVGGGEAIPKIGRLLRPFAQILAGARKDVSLFCVS